MRAHHNSVPVVFLLALLCFLSPGALSSSFAAPTNIYSTQFESAQGYNASLNLAGQNGWTKFGSGGNGLTNGLISGQGQHAYVGRFPPAPGNSNLFVWRPINFSPVAAGLPLVKFTTLMSIVGSTNGYDFFQWHVFNTQGQPLIVLDFDTDVTNVSYFLDGTEYVDSGVKFALSTTYTLTVTMNFAANRWSATLNSALLATNQPITTTGKQLTLGDVDAVWDIYLPNSPGSNFMVFDNYTITAEALPPSGPPVLNFGKLSATNSRCYWSTNYPDYHLEYNDNPTTPKWAASRRTPVVAGTNFVVTNSMFLRQRFYRLSRVPATYTPPPPILSIARVSPGLVRLFWPADDDRLFTLQSCTNLSTKIWAPVPSAPAVEGSSYVVTQSLTGAARFYRLAAP